MTSAGEARPDAVRRVLGGPRETGVFSPAHLQSWPLRDLLSQLEREYLLLLARELGGNVKAMAKRLGVTPRALYIRLRKLGIQVAGRSRRREGMGPGRRGGG